MPAASPQETRAWLCAYLRNTPTERMRPFPSQEFLGGGRTAQDGARAVLERQAQRLAEWLDNTPHVTTEYEEGGDGRRRRVRKVWDMGPLFPALAGWEAVRVVSEYRANIQE